MKKHFGGPTLEDEEREKEEEDIEEEEALRIFAELHRDRITTNQDFDEVSIYYKLSLYLKSLFAGF